MAFESRFWLLGYKNECKLLTLMGMERFLCPTNVYCSQLNEGRVSVFLQEESHRSEEGVKRRNHDKTLSAQQMHYSKLDVQ